MKFNLPFTIPGIEAIKNWLFKLLHFCEFGDSFLYSFYHFIVRTLECKCCIFYRGMTVGFVFGMAWCFFLINLVWSFQ